MYNVNMAIKVTGVEVIDGSGRYVRVKPEAYRKKIVNTVVVRREPGQVGETEFTTLSGRNRARAVRNQTIGFLQDTGDLFPTE